MPFDAATLGYVEEALSGAFNYHNSLDQFFLRSGLDQKNLEAVRAKAENRASLSTTRDFNRAPKRFVVQEALQHLGTLGEEGDRIIATIVTGLVSGSFPDAAPEAVEAIKGLLAKQETESAKRRMAFEEQKARQAQENEALERQRSKAFLKLQSERDSLHDRFVALMSESNTQARGYLLEPFLNDLFEFEGLDPRSSFKITGEQIDGSFLWRSRTNLVEAKWVKKAIAGAEFGAFIYKIDGKTADTRGVYISINGYSSEALAGLNGKGALKFVCLDGSHLMRVLSGGEKLPELLAKLWRHADETGIAYLPAYKL